MNIKKTGRPADCIDSSMCTLISLRGDTELNQVFVPSLQDVRDCHVSGSKTHEYQRLGISEIYTVISIIGITNMEQRIFRGHSSTLATICRRRR